MADGGRSGDLQAARDVVAAEHLGAVIGVLHGFAPHGVTAVLAAALEDLGAGTPDLTHVSDGLKADAAWWADCATPAELEAFCAAALREIPRRAFALKARKRLIVALWESLPDDDRRAFLAAVDPAGKFRGRS